MCETSLFVDLIDLYALPIIVGVTCVIVFSTTVQLALGSNKYFRLISSLFIIFIVVYVLDRLLIKFRQRFTCRQFI